MKIAIISDIHSNSYALESVLADIDTRDVDTIVCTGDLVDYLPFPNEVINMIRDRKIMTLKGNHDKKAYSYKKPTDEEFEAMSFEEIRKSASVAYTSYVLTEQNRKYLSMLPNHITISTGEFELLFVHGSPRAIDEYMLEDADNLLEIAESVDRNVIISGHSHKPYYKKMGAKHLINAGSVGKPKHGSSKSTYQLLEISGDKITCEMIEVSYDVEVMIQAIKENDYISNGLVDVLLEGR